MKHRGTKFLSLLLTLVMAFGLLPGTGATAQAEEITSDKLREGMVLESGQTVRFLIGTQGGFVNNGFWVRVYLDDKLVSTNTAVESGTQVNDDVEAQRRYTTTKKCFVFEYEYPSYFLSLKSLEISDATIELTGATTFTYDGQPHSPTVTVKNASGDTLTLDTDYTLSSATEAGTHSVTVTGAGNYTGSKSGGTFTIERATPTVTAPTPVEALTYTGSALNLVTEGSTTGGEMQYSLDGETYSTAIPTATNAGTYTVSYKVVGNSNYNDVNGASVSVTIAPQAAPALEEAQKPTAKTDLLSGSQPQALVDAPTAALPTGYTMKYAVTTTNDAPDVEAYSDELPTGTDAGTYYVWYKAVGDADHSDTAPVCVTVTIAALTEPVITGYALELGGILGLRYYMALPTGIDYTGATMTFSMNNRENQVIPYSELKTDAQGKFFTCDVYAYQMADTITATFTYKKDGETQTLTDTYSVKQYLDSLKGGEYSDKALNLVNATRAYGHFIQPYLARVNGWAYGEKYKTLDYTGTVNVDAAKTGSEAKKFTLTTMNPDYVQSAQYRLLLNADTSFIVEVKLKATPTESVTMTIDGDADKTTGSGTTYRVELGKIAANNLAMPHQVVMKIGDATVFDFTASPLSYVYTVLSKSSPAEDEQYALASLYEYSQAADAYAGQS